METNNQKSYNADLYLRLSREDGDKIESDSIVNQRNLLMAFLSSHPEIILHKVRIDDGYSGVNFERPAFQEMMESVKNKEINCIIVKDFSRLGRNFIETGKYIEKVFPFMGIRFIAINDNYDSVRPRTASDNLMVPVKNLMNDAYCRDISIKIRSQLAVKRKNGECIAPFAVYGYRKDPENKNQLIIDELAAGTVEDIFKRKLDGYSAQAIADWLNDTGVLSPLEYKRYIGSSFSSPFKRNAKSRWTAVTVLRILKNPVYTGTLVQGKRSTPNYKVKKSMVVPEERWISVENSHEPIISKALFENVSRILLTDTRTAPTEKTVYVLSGLVECGDCHRNMVRKNNSTKDNPYFYYICSGYKQKTGCTIHSIKTQLLEDTVLTAIQEYIRNVLDMDSMLKSIRCLPFTTRTVKKADERLLAKKSEIKKYQCYKAGLYEDYANGIITKEDYISFGKRYDDKIKAAEGAAFLLEQEIDQIVKGNSEEQQWISCFKQYENIQELNRKLAVELIAHIYVYEDQKIHIRFRFQDEYNQIIAFLKAVENQNVLGMHQEVV